MVSRGDGRWSIGGVARALDHEGPIGVAYDEPSADLPEIPIYDLFEAVAGRHPDAIALAGVGAQSTFKQVRRELRALASRIATEVPAGKAVAILLPNVPASVVAVLACLAAGRICLVLNADHPAERNREILDRAEVHLVVILDNSAAASLPCGLPHIAMLDLQQIDPDEESRPQTSMKSGDPAIVLYTSGSTGRPKGIVLSQRTILVRVRNNIVSLHLNTSDRFLSLGALGTTAGVVASIAALLSGATQHVVSVTDIGMSSLLALIERERMTIVWACRPCCAHCLRLTEQVPRSRACARSVRSVSRC